MATTNESPARTPESQHEHPPHHRHSPAYWILFAVLVLGIAALVYFFAWLPRHKRQVALERETSQEVHAIPKVPVLKVEPAGNGADLQVPGTTLAYEEAAVYGRASGYLSRRLVDIGDRVHEGQLLATIDAPDLDKQVAQAASSLQQSQSALAQVEAQLHLQALNNERYKVLVAKGVFSRQQGDQQEADFRVADANVQAAQNTVQANRDNLARLRVLQQYEHVTAPFSGIITARNVDVGDLISTSGSSASPTPPPSGLTSQGAAGNNSGSVGLSSNVSPATGGTQGGAMFSIASVDPLRIFVSVPEAYAGLIHLGTKAQLFLQELPQETYTGHVTRNSSSIDLNTRTLLVELQVRNPRGKLMPGMYTVVNFAQLASHPPLTVPGAAIVVRDGKNMLAVVDSGNVVHFRPIQIGRDYGNEVEIASGLKPGDAIATIITDEVEDGGKIDPQYQKPANTPQAGGQSDRRPGEEGRYGNQKLTNQGSKASKGGAGGGKGQGKSQ